MVPMARSPGLGLRPGAWHVLHQPGDLAGGEIGIEAAGRLRFCTSAPWPACSSFWHRRGAPAILPDDGVVHRLAGLALPQHRRLALVGDADGGNVAGTLAERLAADGNRGVPDLLGIVLDPAIGRDRSAAIPSGRRPEPGRSDRRPWRACWSSPGRSPECCRRPCWSPVRECGMIGVRWRARQAKHPHPDPLPPCGRGRCKSAALLPRPRERGRGSG